MVKIKNGFGGILVWGIVNCEVGYWCFVNVVFVWYIKYFCWEKKVIYVVMYFIFVVEIVVMGVVVVNGGFYVVCNKRCYDLFFIVCIIKIRVSVELWFFIFLV